MIKIERKVIEMSISNIDKTHMTKDTAFLRKGEDELEKMKSKCSFILL